MACPTTRRLADHLRLDLDDWRRFPLVSTYELRPGDARVMHFKRWTGNLERAVNFYQSTFSWEIRKWDGPQEYWIVAAGNDSETAINCDMVHRKSAATANPVNIVEVFSLDEALVRVTDQWRSGVPRQCYRYRFSGLLPRSREERVRHDGT